MELNQDTKLKDIVSAYPSLKTRLAEINPKFSLLNSPIGKVMIGKVTISDMSQRSGRHGHTKRTSGSIPT